MYKLPSRLLLQFCRNDNKVRFCGEFKLFKVRVEMATEKIGSEFRKLRKLIKLKNQEMESSVFRG
jgi:hypothetical protein